MGLVKLECLLQVEVEGAVETVYAAIALLTDMPATFIW